MDEAPKSKTLNQIALGDIRFIGIFGVILGVIALAVGPLVTQSYALSVIQNVGSGLVVAGILSLLFDIRTRKVNDLLTQSIKEETFSGLQILLYGSGGLLPTIKRDLEIHSQASNAMQWEIMRSFLTKDAQKRVFAAGVINAFSQVNWGVPANFLQSQQFLRVVLKDGHDFFAIRKEELKSRFRNPTLKTRILVLHPEYPHMDAVAEMDPYKVIAEKQVSDCCAAIRAMQEIRAELAKEGIEVRNQAELFGYSSVPTWTGFVGDTLAYVSFFSTLPHRGALPTLVVKRNSDRSSERGLFGVFDYEFDQLWRSVERTTSLFDYKLPDETQIIS